MEVASIAILIDEVVIMFGLEVLFVFDDVLAVGHLGQSGNFVEGAGFQTVVLLVLFDGDEFDCEFAHLFGVYGTVDLAETALTDLFD